MIDQVHNKETRVHFDEIPMITLYHTFTENMLKTAFFFFFSFSENNDLKLNAS